MKPSPQEAYDKSNAYALAVHGRPLAALPEPLAAAIYKSIRYTPEKQERRGK